MLLNIINSLGDSAITIFNDFGNFALFLFKTFYTLFTTKLKYRQLIVQMQRIGVESFTIIFLTGASIGLALALQTYIGLERFGAHDFIGVVVALGMTRELGPVMTGLMVTGRSGAGIAAEIGTMKITEQIDALKTLCINPYQYLIVPRIVASTIILPFLTIFSMICGIIGGFLYCTHVLEIAPENYISSIRSHVEFSDITGGLIKSSVFGLILSWIGTYNGYCATGGAKGVGLATTKTVVTSSIMILIFNYLLSALLFKAGGS